MEKLKRLIRTIPDHPKPGIQFRDVTTLFGDAQGFKACIASMTEPYRTQPIDAIAGIEARGFILGGAMADKLGLARSRAPLLCTAAVRCGRTATSPAIAPFAASRGVRRRRATEVHR